MSNALPASEPPRAETLQSWLTRTLARPLTADEKQRLPFPPDEARVASTYETGHVRVALVMAGHPPSFAMVTTDLDELAFVFGNGWDPRAPQFQRLSARHLTETEAIHFIRNAGGRVPPELRERFDVRMNGEQDPRPIAPPAEPSVLDRRRVEHAKEQQNLTLGAERLRILSEQLAAPTRPVRDRWFAAWQAVADSTLADDLDGVVTALATARVELMELNRIATGWLTAAREWLGRAHAVNDQFGTVVGLAYPEPFRFWESAAAAAVPGWLADHREFFHWALAVKSVESLASMPSRMRRQNYPRQTVIDYGLDLLDLLLAGGTRQPLREFFGLTYGCGWLAGMTAVIAATLAPLGPVTQFRAADLPTSATQRESAECWLRLTEFVTECRGYEGHFRKRYFTAPLEPTGSAPILEPLASAANTAVAAGESGLGISLAGADPVRPAWDAKSRTLTVGAWQKQYRRNATNQARVLAAFEAAGWPDRVGKPPGPATLNVTVRDLNDALGADRPITFSMDGFGTGVRWEFTRPSSPGNSPEVS